MIVHSPDGNGVLCRRRLCDYAQRTTETNRDSGSDTDKGRDRGIVRLSEACIEEHTAKEGKTKREREKEVETETEGETDSRQRDKDRDRGRHRERETEAVIEGGTEI